MEDERRRLLGAVEAGGTKFRAAVLDGALDLVDETRIPTTDPDTTLGETSGFFAPFASRIDALGIAAFGPLDLREGSTTFGSIMKTPKPGWSGVDVLGRIRDEVGVPAVIDTDVGAAVLAEQAIGAASGLSAVVYVTVGTGIGGAVMLDGEIRHGHGHSELGHIPVRRVEGDRFAGSCPFHSDCLEGMASGSAVDARREANPDDPPDRFEAAYLAQLVRALTYVVAPQRIVFGGGLFENPDLLPAVHAAVADDLAGYSTNPAVVDDTERYVVTAALGQDAGLIGAGLLARRSRGA